MRNFHKKTIPVLTGRVFVTAAEFLNITEIRGIPNLTMRFPFVKSRLMSTIIFLPRSVDMTLT